MATYKPIYRLRLYAPKSVDPTEQTILTPRSGAPHSNDFMVATSSAATGYLPYLNAPRGRLSQISPLEKHTDTGELTFVLTDKKLSTGNLSRWLTAFFGDDLGGNNYPGLRCEVDESLDNAGSWDRWYTGRVTALRSVGRTRFALSVRELTDDLDADVFVFAPHTAVGAYASQAQVSPLGLLRPYGDFKTVTPLRGTVAELTGAGTYAFRIDIDPVQDDPVKTLASKALEDLHRVVSHSVGANNSYGRGRVMIAPAGTTDLSAYDVYDFDWTPLWRYTSVWRVWARPLKGSTLTPALSTSVDLFIESLVSEVSEQLPIVIDDVHPITLLKALCAGYFGKLADDGSVTWSVATDAGDPGSTFDALEADSRFPVVRFIISERAKLLEWAEENLLRPNQLAWRLNEFGKIELVDLRRSAVASSVATLTSADLVAGDDSVSWETDRAEAVSGITVFHYRERAIEAKELPAPNVSPEETHGGRYADYKLPELPTILIEQVGDGDGIKVVDFGPRAIDVIGEEIEIEATGLRFRQGEVDGDVERDSDGTSRPERQKAHMRALANDIRGPFSLGPTYYELVCKRSSANAALVTVGSTATLDIDELPDPATNLRGGQRLGLCVSRNLDGPRVILRLLDWGANSVAVAPTLGAPALLASDTSSGLSLPVTLNASGQRARVDVAITDTATAARPAEDSELWRQVTTVVETGTEFVTRLSAAGKRAWVRARSEPAAGQGFSLPSAWAFPGTGTGYVDLDAISAPSAVVASSPSGDIVTVSWTVGDADMMTEVFLIAGAVAPTGALSERVGGPLEEGSSEVTIVGLTAAAAQYTVGVRHIGPHGGASSMATDTFTAGATVQLAAPTNPDGFSIPERVLSRAFSRDLGSSRTRYGLAVVAQEHPSSVEIAEAVETGIGTGLYGAYATKARVDSVAGDWTIWSGLVPNDGKRRKLKARHVRDGADPSDYSSEVTITPGEIDLLAAFTVTEEYASANYTLKGGDTMTGTLDVPDLEIGGVTVFTSSRELTNITGNITMFNAGTLTVTRGGTGVSNPTVGNLLVGAGASAMTLLAPGAAGGYVRSNGSAWIRNSGLPAADLTGTIASARLSGSYTGITAVGTLTALSVGSITIGNAITVSTLQLGPPGTSASVLLAVEGSTVRALDAQDATDPEPLALTYTTLNGFEWVDLGGAHSHNINSLTGTPLTEANGGTGLTSVADGALLVGTSASTTALSQITPTLAGEVLTAIDDGGVLIPSWETFSMPTHTHIASQITPGTFGAGTYSLTGQLNVDNLQFDGNTISSVAGTDLLITPLAGQQIVLDGTIVIDAGVVTGATSITSTAFVGALTGNATTATTLQTARTINGVSFNGSANITVTAAAGTLTGATLAAGVTASSLTSLGNLTALNLAGNVLPTTDNTRAIGSASFRFANIHATTVTTYGVTGLVLAATGRLYFDGAVDTYQYQSSDNVVDLVMASGVRFVRFAPFDSAAGISDFSSGNAYIGFSRTSDGVANVGGIGSYNDSVGVHHLWIGAYGDVVIGAQSATTFMGGSNTQRLRIGADYIMAYANFRPSTSSTYDLGLTTDRWRHLWMTGNVTAANFIFA